MKIIFVASAILKRENKILIATRPKNKFLSGYYELPGGKLYSSESFEQCLARELFEEIGVKIDINNLKQIDIVTHRYKKSIIVIMIYLLEKWRGKIKSKERQTIHWIKRNELGKFKFLPANTRLIKKIDENYYGFWK
jgi:8-oxo-dGTP pyrophosphatase MutT (NUDIX family)